MIPFRNRTSLRTIINYRQIQLGQKKFRLKKAPKMLFPDGIERDYIRELLMLTDILKNKTEEIVIPMLHSIVTEADMLRPRLDRLLIKLGFKKDTYVDMIYEAMQKLRFGFGISYTEREMQEVAENIAQLTSDFNRKQVGRVLSTMVGIDVFFSEPWLRDAMQNFTEYNVSLIKSIPNRYYTEIEGIIHRGVQQGLTIDTIQSQIRQRYGVTESKATLIARDQVGKFFGQLNQLRQEDVGIKKYIWRTVGDNRVRPSHRDKDGRIYSWNKPPADTGHPGWDYQCRCWAEPVISLEDIV